METQHHRNIDSDYRHTIVIMSNHKDEKKMSFSELSLTETPTS